MEMDVSGIITAVGGLAGALGGSYALWLKATQKRRDAEAEAYRKAQELKMEEIRTEREKHNSIVSEHTGKIYGMLWELLHATGCERVYIIQPHPLAHHQFISISLEVRKRGTSAMKPNLFCIPMSEAPRLVGLLTSNDWIYSMVSEMEGDASALFSINGTVSVAVKKMANFRNEWVGNLVAESTVEKIMDDDTLKGDMSTAANQIQYILPEYKS
jgi:hypothetical protein